jgi:pSer/pThr/pTyr-binding forkhead associated (FHA) protein
MKAELIPENGDPPIPIVRDVTLVGRRDDCDVVVQHPGVSKRHCVLVKTDGLLVIRDLATTNGTKVKGQRVRWAALLPDDRITLGGYKFRVYLGADDMLAPSEQRGGGQRRGQAADWDTSLGDMGMGVGAGRPAGMQPSTTVRPTEKTFAPPTPSNLAIPALAASEGSAAPANGGEYFEIIEDDDEIIELG